jgi:DNA-binding protein HU-beta
MNRTDLIDAIAEAADLKKVEAEQALQGLLDAITSGLASGDTITLTGFGSFSVSSRAARTGRNPQTGKKIEIAAKKVAKFKPGKNLTLEIN